MSQSSFKLNRRQFLGRTALVTGALTAGCHVNPSSTRASRSTLQKLNIAAIGTYNRAAANIRAVASEDWSDIQEDLADLVTDFKFTVAVDSGPFQI